MALQSRICAMLGIEYPILLAGMGGASVPALAAAVSNASGLGVLGAAACSPEQLRDWIRQTRELTDKPFGVDTLLPALSNLHSHTFQRAMAGMTEVRKAGRDSFWTWRELMYRFMDRLTPEQIEEKIKSLG